MIGGIFGGMIGAVIDSGINSTKQPDEPHVITKIKKYEIILHTHEKNHAIEIHGIYSITTDDEEFIN